MPRTDWAFALLLGGLTLASRIPFRARLLPTWDAVQFALALHEYDVLKHQPHPPGYILYVVAARVVAGFLGDGALALTALAIGAGAATVVLVYRLAWVLYGRPTAVVAAIGLAASPLFWAYGVVGLSYTVEAALATAVAILAWGMRDGRPRAIMWAALALALAGGVRQPILVLLFPLWLGMAWAGARRWRPVVGGALVLALGSAAWLGPMVWLAGGVRAYVGAAVELFESTVRSTTIWGTPGRWLLNVSGLGEAFLAGLGVFLPIVGWFLVRAVGRTSRWSLRTGFFAAWILPALGVYAFVHLGQGGYLLTVLPACYIVAARALLVLGRRLGAATRPAVARWAPTAALSATAVLAHAGFFVAAAPIDVAFPPASAPWTARWTASLRGVYRFGLWANTAAGLREREAVIATFVETVRRGFDPTETVVVTELGNPRSYPWFRHVMYYLPEFTVYHLRLSDYSHGYVASQPTGLMAALDDHEIVLPPNTRRLVWVVDYWNPLTPRPPGLEARALPHGRWLYVLSMDGRPVEHAGYRLMPLPAVARLR